MNKIMRLTASDVFLI